MKSDQGTVELEKKMQHRESCVTNGSKNAEKWTTEMINTICTSRRWSIAKRHTATK